MTAPPTALTSSRANVDPGELAKFGALAHHWWDPESAMFGPLHRINPLRLDWIERVLRRRLPARGSSTSAAAAESCSEAMAAARRDGARHRPGREGARRRAAAQARIGRDRRLSARRRRGARRRNAAARSTSSPAWSCWSTCPIRRAIVAACAALAKPGGIVAISTINRNPKAYALAVLGAEYVLRLLPRGTHDYAKFLTPAESRALRAPRRARTPIEVTGLAYNPLAKTRSARAGHRASTT